MAPRIARVTAWTVRVLAGFGLLLALVAALLWWWAGREGSLEWILRRVTQGVPMETQGIRGSVRGGWQIDRVVWEREGLRLVAEDIRLEWQPVALIDRTLQLERVQVARVRVTDTRPPSGEPLKPPENLRLPWLVRVERLEVGSLAYEGRMAFEAGPLAARYAFDGRNHEAQVESLQVAGGSYRGRLVLLAAEPLDVDAQLEGWLAAPVPGGARVPVVVQAKAKGPMRAVAAEAQLRVARGRPDAPGAPSATASAQVMPFAAMPVPRAQADVRHLDLALFWPAAPRTDLSGQLEVQPAGSERYRLQAELRNAAAGPWDQQRLPVSELRGAGEWRGGVALVQSLAAQAGGGSIEGSGAWEGEGWRFDGKVAQVDPARLHTRLAPVPLSGPLKLSGAGKAVAFDVALQAGAPRRGSGDAMAAAAGAMELRDIVAKGQWSGDAVSVAPLRVRTSDALLEGEGRYQLAARAGEGKFSLRAPGLQARASGSSSETRGQGNAEIEASDLAQAQRWLARWPGMGDALRGLALRGQAQTRLAWQGGWRDPTVQGQAGVRSLAWQPASGAADAPPPWVVREANLQVQGRLRDASLDLRGQAQQGQRQVELLAAGRLGATLGPATSWRGQVASLEVRVLDPGITPGPWRVQLRRPVDWRAAGGNFELAAGEASLQAPAMRSGVPASEAVLSWGPVRRQGNQLTTSGRLAGLPLAWIELLGGSQLAGSALAGDMVFDAQWDALWGPNVRLQASLARVRGDVSVLAESADGSAARVSAGVRQARFDVRTQGEQIEASLLWDSERAGRAEGQVRSRLVRTPGGGWAWPENAPLAGRVQAQLPRIGVWSVLAPPGWRLRGSLAADVQVAGTRAQPEFTGPLRADDLALRSVVEGIELRNGRLRAQLAGRRLVVSEFVLHGSPEGGSDGGTVVAHGEAGWTPRGPELQVEAMLSQLRASVRSDRQLTVSGPVSARMQRGSTTVTGNLVVDRARIVIPDETPPRLGEDVVVRNAPGIAGTEAERRQRPPADANSKLDLRVDFDLGPDFRVSGRGLQARLEGKPQIRAAADGTPLMTGLIRTVGGTFEAYGQRMNIERGELRFTGPPDNPALDILAVRPNMVQKVGVQVTGRAQSPHIELYSDSGLSEAETLSYVVLGRASSGSGAETALLQRAAGALLAGKRGTGKGLAGSLGLDDLSVTPDDTAGAVVRIGKRFADNFYASYERSLSGAMGTLFLFYDVSRKLTVRAEAGERTGVDLIFTFTF